MAEDAISVEDLGSVRSGGGSQMDAMAAAASYGESASILDGEGGLRGPSPTPTKDSEAEEDLQPRYVPKHRRKYPDKDVPYTDKDRAAAAGIGDKDTKVQFQVKKKKDTSDIDPRERELEIHRALTGQQLNQHRPERALKSANRALTLEPENFKCLVARAQCFLQLGRNEEALKDAESALKLEPGNVKAIYQKAEAFYMMGVFESALVYYQRGLTLRPDMDIFRLGVQKSQEAIRSSVGPYTRIKLHRSQVEKLRERQAAKAKNRLFQSSGGGKAGKGSLEISATPSMLQHRTPEVIRKEEAKLLKTMAVDKDFCRKLTTSKELSRIDKPGGRAALEAARSILSFMEVRQEFWRQQKPVNPVLPPKQVVAQVHLRMRKKGGIYANLPNILRQVDGLLLRIQQGSDKHPSTPPLIPHPPRDKKPIRQSLPGLAPSESLQRSEDSREESLSGSRWRDVITLSRRLQTLLLPVHYTMWPEKANVVCAAYCSMGNACLELGQLERALICHQRELEIATKRNLRDATDIALEHLGKTYVCLHMYDKAVFAWRQWLPRCSKLTLRSWLLHEIGRCHLELNEVDLAQDCGLKAIQSAYAARDNGLLLNATVLVAQTEVLLDNFLSAVDLMEKSVTLARKLRLPASLVADLDSAREQVIKLMREANLSTEEIETHIFFIEEDEKTIIFPKSLLTALKYRRSTAPEARVSSVSARTVISEVGSARKTGELEEEEEEEESEEEDMEKEYSSAATFVDDSLLSTMDIAVEELEADVVTEEEPPPEEGEEAEEGAEEEASAPEDEAEE